MEQDRFVSSLAHSMLVSVVTALGAFTPLTPSLPAQTLYALEDGAATGGVPQLV